MVTNETLRSTNGNFFFPDELNDKIPSDLVVSGLPGDYTDKHYLRGYPDLLVRSNAWGPPLEDIIRASDAFAILPHYGIDALPHTIVEHQGKPYTVTYKVEGDALDEIVENGPDDSMVVRIDTLYANLASYAMSCKLNDNPCARDIYRPCQYMYGTIADDEESRLWLVDIGQYALEFSENQIRETYARDVQELASIITNLEKKLQRPLMRGRNAVEQAAEITSDSLVFENIIRALGNSAIKQ